MANYAVAAALASYTPLLVASETNEYGGLKYEVIVYYVGFRVLGFRVLG